MSSLTQPFVIIGLGNPGQEYHNSRHNVGYCVLDAFLKYFPPVQTENNKLYFMAKSFVNNKVFYLVKPLTYMNLSGKIINDLQRKIGFKSENLLVVVDNLDLEFTKCKLKEGGGNAGHNGLKSISEYLGHSNYSKLYVGIGRPQSEQTVSSYVLSRFNSTEEPKFLSICDELGKLLALLSNNPFNLVQKEINTIKC